MQKKNRGTPLRLLGLLLLVAVFLAACSGREYHSAASYFDGVVAVEYNQNLPSSSDDYLTFRFYEEGTYAISFSVTPDKSDRRGDLPEDFVFEAASVPREIVVEEYLLADFLRVTITWNGQSEHHDFS